MLSIVKDFFFDYFKQINEPPRAIHPICFANCKSPQYPQEGSFQRLHPGSERTRFSHAENKKGFTLIELLVAISIIAIVSSVGLLSYAKFQSLARDTKRKNDLRSIATALEVYYQKNNRYPCSFTGQTSSSNQPWISDIDAAGCQATQTPLDRNYINELPTDPLKNNYSQSNPDSYGYLYQTPKLSGGTCPIADGQYYILTARLENQSDGEACSQKTYFNCTGQPICSSESGGSLFVLQPQ
ncbi:type II secretion system protein [Candidatus Daviesbacteria bacterium]|nr:type II secretion system protein [Candidatus Daviesbacteria bacterium]